MKTYDEAKWSELDGFIQEIFRVHKETVEEFITECVYGTMAPKDWTLRPGCTGDFQIIYSKENSRAMAVTHQGKLIKALEWDCPGGTYYQRSYFPFPYNP